MTQTKTSPMQTLRRLGGWIGGSVGQAEALAGINVQSEAERKALWDQFQHLFSGEPQVLLDAVMNHCAAITLKRLRRGELSLLPSTHWSENRAGAAADEIAAECSDK